MLVKLDSREPIKIKKMAEKIFEQLEINTLDIADIIVEELGLYIERKSIEDFISSFQSGHLQKQLIKMNNVKNPVLIISGFYKDLNIKFYKITINQYLGMLRHTGLKYKAKVFQVADDNQLLILSAGIIKSLSQKETFLFFGESKVIQKELPPIIKVLMLIKGISIHTATLINKEYSNLKDIKDLCMNKCINIKGLGKKRQESIFKFLSKIL